MNDRLRTFYCPRCDGSFTAPMPATMGMIYMVCADCGYHRIYDGGVSADAEDLHELRLRQGEST
jgi:hypothetical protein